MLSVWTTERSLTFAVPKVIKQLACDSDNCDTATPVVVDVAVAVRPEFEIKIG
jgi:hypothetical protein